MNQYRIYRGRCPLEIYYIFAMIVLGSTQAYSLININTYQDNQFLAYVATSLIILSLIIVAILIYRLFTKPFEIQVHSKFIVIKGIRIEAKNTKSVYIKGYFRPVLGIRPKGNVMVPHKYCFQFIEEEDQGIREIMTWAEQNQIKVCRKRFMRWV